MCATHRFLPISVVLVILAFGSQLLGQAAKKDVADQRPEASTLNNDWRVWLEAGDHLPLVDAKKLTALELLDLDAAKITWSSSLKIRLVCDIKPDVEIVPTDRHKAETQLQVLFADPQAGFLKQTLPNYQFFSTNTTDGRGRLGTVLTLAEARLGPLVAGPQPPPTAAPPTPTPARKAEPVRPAPTTGVRALGPCDCLPCNPCDPCSSVVAGCSPPACWSWAPRRRFLCGGCAVVEAPVCGVLCSPCAAVPPPTKQAAVGSGSRGRTAQYVSHQEIARHFSGQDAARFVSLTRPAARSTPQDRTLAAELFRIACQAYWKGDYAAALQQLDLAISLNGGDARVWYFKGFCEVAQGHREAASASLARAVQLHAQQPRDPAIIKSLERVQGDLRNELQQALLLAPRVPPQPPQPQEKPPAADLPLVAQAH
jgi:tetratricopeptide (TPR) repeat protein